MEKKEIYEMIVAYATIMRLHQERIKMNESFGGIINGFQASEEDIIARQKLGFELNTPLQEIQEKLKEFVDEIGGMDKVTEICDIFDKIRNENI